VVEPATKQDLALLEAIVASYGAAAALIAALAH
jgi:hypothetical protein